MSVSHSIMPGMELKGTFTFTVLDIALVPFQQFAFVNTPTLNVENFPFLCQLVKHPYRHPLHL